MISLVTHYRVLFAWAGLGGLFIIGFVFGLLVGILIGRSDRRGIEHGKALDRFRAEYKAAQARHKTDTDIIIDLESRLFKAKAQFAELTSHLGKAMEAIK